MKSIIHGKPEPRHLAASQLDGPSVRPAREPSTAMDNLEADFGAYQNRVATALVATTRAAGQLSAGDLSFHRSTLPAVAKGIDAQNMRLLRLTNKLLRNVSAQSKVPAPPKLQSLELVDDNWRGIIDVVDDLLEKADRNLDEFTGIIRSVQPSFELVDDTRSKKLKGFMDKFPTIYDSSLKAKPQEKFAISVNNFEQGPWKPLLRKKPHAYNQLDKSLKVGKHGGYYLHPYETEIKRFSYPSHVYEVAEPIPYTDPNQVPVEFVDTESGIDRMLGELRSAREIAVDLEHHDTHSYYGIVSLMQISTRSKDWVVDTLQPWRENLQVLNDVFVDPNILKVFHGSNSDMIWLQRDLGLYVVGLFDTMHAATALNLPQKGLKYLLQTYADFTTSKKYQIADWRVRPLLPGMLEYARADTHYLLFVYDRLRNSLIERSTQGNELIDYVLQSSKKEALQCYHRVNYMPGTGPTGWQAQILRRKTQMDKQQFAVYRALHDWRDVTARTMDEGIPSILPNKQLDSVVKSMPLTISSLMKAANPVTKAVQKNAQEILNIIKKALEEGKNGISVIQAIAAMEKSNAVADVSKEQQVEVSQPSFGSDIGDGALSNKSDNLDNAQVSRTRRSQLWGGASPRNDSIPNVFNRAAQSTVTGLQELLWPTPIEAGSHHAIEHSTSTQIPTTVPSNHINSVEASETVKADDENSIFTIRPGKTSAKFPSEAPDVTMLDVGLSTGKGEHGITATSEAYDPRQLDRHQRKKLSKAGKRMIGNDTVMHAAPFDYANAPSVLEESAADGKGVSKTPRFDPYAKALDAPSGLKKRRQPSGKSQTFHK